VCLSAWPHRFFSCGWQEGGEDTAIGNAPLAGTTVLEPAQLRRKPLQIGDFALNLFQVIFRDAVDSRTLLA
jgi:hypothetical protein